MDWGVEIFLYFIWCILCWKNGLYCELGHFCIGFSIAISVHLFKFEITLECYMSDPLHTKAAILLFGFFYIYQETILLNICCWKYLQDKTLHSWFSHKSVNMHVIFVYLTLVYCRRHMKSFIFYSWCDLQIILPVLSRRSAHHSFNGLKCWRNHLLRWTA